MMYQGILLPVFVLVALTFGVLFSTGFRPSLTGGPAQGWFNYHLHTLFYAVVALALPLRQAEPRREARSLSRAHWYCWRCGCTSHYASCFRLSHND